jgi:hypothetical protein
MRKIKVIRIIGIIIILFGLVANPLVVGHFFGGTDKNIASLSINFMIIVFEAFAIMLGSYLLHKRISADDNNMIKNLIVLLTSMILIVFSIELISFIIINSYSESKYDPDFDKIKINLYKSGEKDDNLGYVLKKRYTGNALKSFSNGSLIYNVTYSTDQYGRRNVNQKYIHNNSHILLFGGSFTFGEGLNDNETLQYMLGKGLPEYNIYNYGVYGYGPHQMLALLESERLLQEVKSSKGLAFYIYMWRHIQRSIGSTTEPQYGAPFYYLDNTGTLQRKGSFISGRPVKTKIYRIFLKVKDKSNFLKLIGLHFPIKISDKDIRLTYEIIAHSKKRYEEQFNGTFYVLIHPSYMDENAEKLISLLETNNVDVLNYHIENYQVRRQYVIPGDGHPNAKLNIFLSEKLINEFK